MASCSSRGSERDDTSTTGATASPRGLPDSARCEALAQSYSLGLLGSDHCERDDECVVEPRGRLYTGLDGCRRLTSRRFDLKATDRLAAEWLQVGCARSFDLCPEAPTQAICRGGQCRERPPPPIAEDWVRVDVEQALTVFLPPEVGEAPYQRDCGNGPAVRTFRGAGLEVRIEYGYELGYLPLTDAIGETDLPVRAVTRTKRKVGGQEVVLLAFERANVASQALAPDGSWPSVEFIRALSARNLDDRLRSGFLSLGQGTGLVSMAILIEGPRARDPVAAKILDSLSFW